MWSLPTRISSSWRPTIFFLGQLVSSSLNARHMSSVERRTEGSRTWQYRLLPQCASVPSQPRDWSTLKTRGIHTSALFPRKKGVWNNTHSPSESSFHFGNWNCWRIVVDQLHIQILKIHDHVYRCDRYWLTTKQEVTAKKVREEHKQRVIKSVAERISNWTNPLTSICGRPIQ